MKRLCGLQRGELGNLQKRKEYEKFGEPNSSIEQLDKLSQDDMLKKWDPKLPFTILIMIFMLTCKRIVYHFHYTLPPSLEVVQTSALFSLPN